MKHEFCQVIGCCRKEADQWIVTCAETGMTFRVALCKECMSEHQDIVFGITPKMEKI